MIFDFKDGFLSFVYFIINIHAPLKSIILNQGIIISEMAFCQRNILMPILNAPVKTSLGYYASDKIFLILSSSLPLI